MGRLFTRNTLAYRSVNDTSMPGKYRDYWQRILSIGQQPTMDFDQKVRLAVINALCVLSMGMVTLFSLVFALLGSLTALQSLSLLPVLLGVLWLNKNGFYAVSRFALTFGLMVILFSLSLLDRRTGTEYGILAVACGSAFFYTGTRWMLASFFSACALYAAYVFIDSRLPFTPDPTANYLLIQTIVLFMAISIIFAAMFQFRLIINRYSATLNEINQELAVKNEELLSLNEGLDEAVKQRTRQISKQNVALEWQKEKLLKQQEQLNASVKELHKRNVSLDVTIKELEQRNYELDRIIYRLSHDLRGPLMSIVGVLHLMDGSKDAGFIRDCLSRIGWRVHHMDAVLHSMLSFAEVTIGKLTIEPVDLTVVIEEAIDQLSSTEGFRETTFTILPQSPECGKMMSDPQKLRILFGCICANALTFRRIETVNLVNISVYRSGTLVGVEVSDNGIGIDESAKAHVFDMFYRGSSQSKGAGLGLYIARETARKLGGTVSLSDNHAGTTVRVMLPVGD